jgi:carboxyvinyl-carboxyphosphonate phosphorylmutase
MRTARERRDAVRALLAGEGCVHPASVHDPISARIAEENGFEAGMLAGSIALLAVLGAPDQMRLTPTKFAEPARGIGRASGPPAISDADHGTGNALNAMRAAEEFPARGRRRALRRGHGRAPALRDDGAPAGVARRGSRKNPRGTGGAGRCLAGGDGADGGVTGLGDALARIAAYEAAGADAIFLTGVTTRAELDAIAERARLPQMRGTQASALALSQGWQ